jgi:hypothetical protein
MALKIFFSVSADENTVEIGIMNTAVPGPLAIGLLYGVPLAKSKE